MNEPNHTNIGSPRSTPEYMIIAVEESDSTVGFYRSSTGEEVGRIQVGRWPHEIEVSPDQRTAYVTNFGVKDYDEHIGEPGASISVIDLQHLCEVDRLYTFRTRDEWQRYRGPHGVKLSPDGRSLFVNVELEHTMLRFDLDSPSSGPDAFMPMPDDGPAADSLPDDSFRLPEGTHNFLFSGDGTSLFLASGHGGVTCLDTQTWKERGSLSCGGAVRGLTYTADGTLLVASASGEICLVDPQTLTVVRRFKELAVKQLLYSAPTPDGRHILAPAVWEGQLLVIDAESGEVRKRLVVGADPIHVLVAPDGASAYVSHGRSKFISVIDLERFEERGRISTRGGPNGLAFAPLPEAAAARLLRFGATIPLSGVNNSEGQDLRLGYQFWQELINGAGGIVADGVRHTVEVVFRDSGSAVDEEVIGRLTRELVEDEGVDFLFGGYPSPPNLHAAVVAEEHKIPLVTASGAAEVIYNQGLEYIFGAMSSATAFLEGTFRYLITLDPKPSSVVFLSCDDPAALGDAQTTAKIVADLGVEVRTVEVEGLSVSGDVIVFPHLKSEADVPTLHSLFGKLFDAFAGSAPDVFVQTGHLPESVALVESARQRKFQPKAFAFSVGPAMPEFTARLGPAAEHMLGSAMWSAGQHEFGHDRFVRPVAFARRYFERYSKEASYLAAGAMVCGVLFEDAIRRAGSVDPAAVRDALRTTDLSTFYSKVAFDERGLNVGRPLVTVQLQRRDGGLHQVVLWPREIASGDEATWPFPGWPGPVHSANHGHPTI